MLKLPPKSLAHAWKTPKAKHLDFDAIRLKAEKREENLPTTVQGQGVGSKEEARVAVALGYLRLPFNYQYWLFGGRDFRGGMILDFLVFTKPLPTPLLVQGVYWHGPGTGKGTTDKLNMAKLRRMMTGWADPKEVWDYQIPTVDDAVRVLASMFGRY